jgi:single-strand DNA-binding protein
MFGDVNRVTLMGNVTKDPDLRYTPSGAAVISFGLATNRRYKKGEEWVDEVSFHNIVVWQSAEQLAQRIKKGTRIYIEGRLNTRSWDGQDGKKNYKTEVVSDKVILIARYEGSNDQSQTSNSGSNEPVPAEPATEKTEDTIDPNDLPF